MIIIFVLNFFKLVKTQDQATLPQTPVFSQISYLKGSEYQQLYSYLLSQEVGYTKAQLAEIGGESIGEYILHLSKTDVPLRKIIFIIGQEIQGSSFENGYFGLAAARYLQQRKVEVEVVLLYPNDALRSRLAMQCKVNQAKLHFNVLKNLQDQLNVQMTKNILAHWLNEFDLVIDAISMNTIEQPKSPIREFLHAFQEIHLKTLAINLPTGWHTDNGNLYNVYVPRYIISLGLPLKGTKEFEENHVIGGRFIPPTEQYTLPKYKIEDNFHTLQK